MKLDERLHVAVDRRMRATFVAAGVVVGLALLVRVATLDAENPLASGLSDAVTLTVSVIIESLPFLFLGIVVSILVQLFVPPKVIAAVLPREGFLRRGALSLFGIVFPVCECGNVPLARGLMVRGLSVADSMTFLLAAPILNPVTIITTYQAFGWDDGILAARIAGGFVIANLVGWLFSKHPAPDALLTPAFAYSCHHAEADVVRGGRLGAAAQLFQRETATMVPALFIGAIIAGVIQVVISRDALAALGAHPLIGILALMALAFVIAICSSVDAFFALSLASTFSPGALVAFLVFGPMLDVKMVAILRTTFSARTIVLVTLLVGAATLALALGVNLVV